MASDCTWFDGLHPFIDRYGIGKPPTLSKTDLDSIHTLIATQSHIIGPYANKNCAALKTITTAHNGSNFDSRGEATRADQEASIHQALTLACGYPRTSAP